MGRRSLAQRVRRAAVSGLVGFVLFLVVGNVFMVGMSAWARETTVMPRVDDIPGVDNLRVVDERLWRGAAPNRAGYRALAARGVKTIVDLRAEEHIRIDHELFDRLGVRLVRIPIRDGQTPTDDEIRRFLRAVEESEGITFVHCGAGVGRTGTMAASYLLTRDEASPTQALRKNLAVGPPSLEQVAFVVRGADRPMAAVTLASRVLDAPRRIWSRLRH